MSVLGPLPVVHEARGTAVCPAMSPCHAVLCPPQPPPPQDISADVVQILRSCFRLRHLSLYRSVRATREQCAANNHHLLLAGCGCNVYPAASSAVFPGAAPAPSPQRRPAPSPLPPTTANPAAAAQAQAAFDIGFATQLTSLGLRCTFSCDDALARLCTQLTNLRRLDLSGGRLVGPAAA